MTRRAALVLAGLILLSIAGCTTSRSAMPPCNRPEDRTLVLMAQSVPTATKLPCITGLPSGWSFGGSLVGSDIATMWLDSDLGGLHAVQIDLVAGCDTSGAVEVPAGPGEAGTRVFQEPTSLPPRFESTRFIVFEGGCLRTRYSFSSGAPATLALEANTAVGLIARSAVAAVIEDEFDLVLCGAGEPPCDGSGE